MFNIVKHIHAKKWDYCSNFESFFMLYFQLIGVKEYNRDMSSLQAEFEYYLKNQKELVKKYKGKYLVIKDREVKGDFESELDAYGFASKSFEPGTFLIQPCLPGEESYTQTFYSRVRI